MELQEFVRTTLIQIAEGVSEANAHLKNGATGALINPSGTYGGQVKDAIHPVEFDVALTVSDESVTKGTSESGGKAGILTVASVNAKVGSEDSGSNRREAVSRVKFTVSMQQPANIIHSPPLPQRTVNRGFA